MVHGAVVVPIFTLHRHKQVRGHRTGSSHSGEWKNNEEKKSDTPNMAEARQIRSMPTRGAAQHGALLTLQNLVAGNIAEGCAVRLSVEDAVQVAFERVAAGCVGGGGAGAGRGYL